MVNANVMELLDINGTAISNPLDWIGILKDGFGAKTVDIIADRMDVTQKDMARLLDVSPKTIERYRANRRKKFSPAISEKLLKIASVRIRSEDVFTDPALATEWLKSECVALGGKTPIEMMEFDFGIDMVLDVLGRIEHGIAS